VRFETWYRGRRNGNVGRRVIADAATSFSAPHCGQQAALLLLGERLARLGGPRRDEAKRQV
jgi:hypothetical protein